MVSIALRTYNSEIGDMIDHQQIEEAIAHCRHILESYPKHVGTYRLLGKAYLEEKRYADASDILQRVLSSAPEDFIAHVGMSIIREDEGNLDAAIYHMERAFETQPSNHAIQDELRRLYASRDGIEPPRIRLTRGALARMYAHGHLYDQAIAELLAAISEDAQRFDLQTLLAEMYYLNGKKVDSAETCTKILEKLPYCLKANQLLTIILEENDRAEDAERYRQRWVALEPYAAFSDPENDDPDLVPESKIKIDHLEWEPQSFLDGPDAQPVWASSLGVTLDGEDDQEEEIPDWFDEDAASDEVDLPGFVPDDDDADDDLFSFDEPSELPTFDDEEAEPATEDWVRDTEESDDAGLFADETMETEPEEEDQAFDFLGEESTEKDDDWMAEFAVPDSTESEGLIDETVEMDDDWPGSLDASEEVGAEAPETDDEEDWIASLGAIGEELPEEPTIEEEEEEDWIASLETDQETGEEDEVQDEEEASDDDWLASLGDAEEVPGEPEEEEQEEDWIASLDVGLEDSEEEEQTAEMDAGEDDWLASLGDADDEEPGEPEEEEQEEDWIASLGVVAEESEEDEQPAEVEAGEDDWLASLGDSDVEEPKEPEIEEQEEDVELPEFLKDAGWEKSTGELDETGEYQLEFDEEQPEEIEQADIPDWIREMAPSEEEEEQPGLPTSEISAEADPEWLEELDQKPDSPAPDWLSELDEPITPETGEVEPEDPIAGKEIQADDQDMAWLESLAAKQGIPDEELVTSPEQRADVSEDHLPEGMREGEDRPAEEASTDEEWMADLIEEEPGTEEEAEWLSELGGEPEVEPEAPAPAGEEVQAVLEDEDDFDMDWLDEIGKEAAEEAAATSMEAAPAEELEEAEVDEEWLADLTEEEEPEEAEDEWLSELEGEPEAPVPTDEEVQAVLEDEDDFDMDWLDEIGKEAAEEAAATSMEAAPAEELEDAEVDEEWLAELVEEEEPEADDEWLSELEGEPEAPVPADEEVQAVLEDEDDFDMDWLDEIGKEAAEEAAATSMEAAPAEELEEAEVDEEWLADLVEEEEPEEAEAEWLSELGDEPEAEPEAPAPTGEEVQAVLEDEDDFDMDWLDEIGQEAAEEAAATSIEEPAPEEPEEPLGDVTAAWLTAVGSELDEEAPRDPDTQDEATSSGVTDFLLRVGGQEPEESDEVAAEIPESVDEDQEEVSPEMAEEPVWQAEEVHPAVEEPIEIEEEDYPAEFPDSIQEEHPDMLETRILDDDQLLDEAEESPDAVPTMPAEWQPESQVEDPVQEEEPPVDEPVEPPAEPSPDSAEEIFESAKTAADKGHLDDAIKGFRKLITKGKLVNEVIAEIKEALRRHPVHVEFWEALGDAYMRQDNLQEALDSYTKAEELLR